MKNKKFISVFMICLVLVSTFSMTVNANGGGEDYAGASDFSGVFDAFDTPEGIEAAELDAQDEAEAQATLDIAAKEAEIEEAEKSMKSIPEVKGKENAKDQLDLAKEVAEVTDPSNFNKNAFNSWTGSLLGSVNNAIDGFKGLENEVGTEGAVAITNSLDEGVLSLDSEVTEIAGRIGKLSKEAAVNVFEKGGLKGAKSVSDMLGKLEGSYMGTNSYLESNIAKDLAEALSNSNFDFEGFFGKEGTLSALQGRVDDVANQNTVLGVIATALGLIAPPQISLGMYGLKGIISMNEDLEESKPIDFEKALTPSIVTFALSVFENSIGVEATPSEDAADIF